MPIAVAAVSSWGSELLKTLEVRVSPEPALAAAQQRAAQALADRPLPSRRQEAWRFTDIAPLLGITTALLPPATTGPATLPRATAGVVRLVLDGHGDPLAGVSLPTGIEPIPVADLEALLQETATDRGEDRGATGASNHAAARAGSEPPWSGLLAAASAGQILALRVRGFVEPTLELVSDAASAEGVLPLRLLLILEPEARLELLQVHRAAGASLTTVLLEARLGAGAQLSHGLIGQGVGAAVLLADLAIDQQPGSHYAFTSAVAGWALSRLEPRVLQSAGGATTRLRSLQRVYGREIADQHSQVRFEGPEGELDQLHKAIADGAGRSVFNGAVAVPRAAQRTNAVQLSRSLLLSDRARIDTKPQLEIVADDVKCAHGATVSRLQSEELFYLQSRGIAAANASRLLLRGFCGEVLRELPAAAAIWQPLAMVMAEEASRP
ncbi:MAG: SufD family Fe-S cluster assembly protein [Cyanobacteria bacterium]|nr:SufD family Fe-S cluster assembly protein [Cyanobacteriota bacterium]